MRIERALWLALPGVLLAAAAAVAQPPGEAADDPDTLRGIRDALMGAEDFSAALAPAERLVERSERAESAAEIGDLIRLASIQAELDMFADAELNYLEAIELLRDSEGQFSATLVPAYRALGRAYLDNGDFERAIAVLEEAQHISQRDAGLYNVEQSALIDDMTLAHLGLGDTPEARELQVERLENAVRQFGEDDPRTVPFYNSLADYYSRSRMRMSARELYQQSLAVQESVYGERDPRLLPTLRALLGNELALGETTDTPERIGQILEADQQLPARERSESLAALGDWALIHDGAAEAAPYYARAYSVLERENAAEAAELFGEPRMLDFVAPLSPVDRATRSRPYSWGTIALEFDVSAEGRAVGVETVAMEPRTSLHGDYVRRVRETYFRPRLVGGEPAATRGVRFAHEFRYYVARERD